MNAQQTTLTRWRPSDQVALRLLALFATWTLLATAGGPSAVAQVNTEALIGHAVTDIGSRFPNVEQAITRFRNNDVEGAREFLRQAKEKHPELPVGDAILARLYFSSGQTAAGRNVLERAVRDSADDPEAYLLLAEIALREQQFTAAELLYRQSARINKALEGADKRKRNDQIRALGGLARVAEQRGHWDKAATFLEQWTKMEPDRADTWHRLGQARFMADKVDTARAALVKARELNPALEYPDVTISRLYKQRGKTAEAKASMKAAIEKDAGNPTTQLAYAQVLLEASQVDKARPLLQAALKAQPDSVVAMLFAGVEARMRGDLATAERYLGNAYLLDPGNATVTYQLAMVLSEQDDPAKLGRAAVFAASAVQRQPNNGDLHATLGWIYYQLGRTAQAQTELNEAVKRRNLNADSRFLLARILFDRGRNEQATQVLQPAMKAAGIFVKRKEAQQLLDRIGK